MRRNGRQVFLPLVLLICVCFNATAVGLGDLDLAQTPAEVRDLLPILTMLEPMTQYYVAEWTYQTPKEEVIAEIEAAYGTALAAAASRSDDLELALLEGLIAHYAYQLDLQDYYERSLAAFARAAAIAPDDIRPPWFRGVHLAKAALIKEGMAELLAVAGRREYTSYPPSFWEDYAYCAYLACMPAHARMGLARAKELLGEPSGMEKMLGRIIRNAFSDPPRGKALAAPDLWSNVPADDTVIYMNRAFGMAIECDFKWLPQLGPSNGETVGIAFNGPQYTGCDGWVLPVVLIMAHIPGAGETLADFTQRAINHPVLKFEEDADFAFPYAPASVYVGRSDEMYGNEGGAHTLVIAFSRSEPAYPGVALESPVEVKTQEGGGMQYYRMSDMFDRYHGEIYYVVIFDCAESVYDKAVEDFQELLAGLKVD